MKERFIVTTYNQGGEESKRTEDAPYIIEAESILAAAELIEGGTVMTDATHFALVGRLDGQRVMRFVVTPEKYEPVGVEQ